MDSRASQYSQYSNSSTSSGPPARDGTYSDPKSSKTNGVPVSVVHPLTQHAGGNYVDVVQRKGPKGVVVVINHHMANPDPNEPRSSDCR